MSGVNKAIIVGRCGKDPELKQTATGVSVCNFSLATSKKKSGGEEVTEWHNITAWQKTADLVAQYVRKGSLVYVEGELQTRKWDKDGQTHYRTEIVANQVTFLDSKSDGQRNADHSGQPQRNQGLAGVAGSASHRDDSDTVPF